MIADMETNKKLHPIVTELPLSGRKLKHFTGPYVIILFQSV